MSLKLKIGALTDVGLVRANNEDNFLTIPDLTLTATGCDSARVIDLGRNGALMVVADGMGGMNAGEVASQLAVNAIKEAFSPVNITPELLKNRTAIERFMNDAIVMADTKIKAAANRNPESQGMGTTIVLAWILADKLYVSWCGDSRAYVFNSDGLHQITKDHSYVQSLVDQGQLSRAEIFDHPKGNVITRSLCDAMGPAEPECLFKPYPLANGDTIILCTDGVCGMLRDSEFEQVIGSSPDDLDSLMGSISEAVKKVGAADNFTMCIAQIVDGAAAEPDTAFFKTTEAMLDGKITSETLPAAAAPKGSHKLPWKLIAIVAIVAIICAVAVALIFSGDKPEKAGQIDEVEIIESINQEQAPAATTAPAPSSKPSKPAAKPGKSGTKTEPAKTPDKEESSLLQSITGSKPDANEGSSEPDKTTPSSLINAFGKKQENEPATTTPATTEEPAMTEPQPTPAPANQIVPPPAKSNTDNPENAVKSGK